jgi:hypothetical protein
MTMLPPCRNRNRPPSGRAATGRTTVRLAALGLALWAWVLPAWARADPETSPGLRRALAVRLPTAVLPNVAMRDALRNAAHVWGVPVVADRRVDPDRCVDLKFHDATIDEILKAIAQSQKLGVTCLGPVAYLGPKEPAGKLLTLSALRHDEVRKLPEDAARRWEAKSRFGWPDFATPRSLLEQLAKDNDLQLKGLGRVPHDLWAGVDLPGLSLVDRFTLVAIQFDLTFQIGDDGASVELVPIPERVAVVRSHPGQRDPAATAQKLAQLAPEAEVRVLGEKVYVRGRIEDHRRLREPGGPPATSASKTKPKAKPSPGGTRMYTISTKPGPLDVLLTQLGTNLGLEVRLDRAALEAAGISPSQQVSLSVKNATIDEIFRALLKPAGCAFRRQDDVVEVFPAR